MKKMLAMITLREVMKIIISVIVITIFIAIFSIIFHTATPLIIWILLLVLFLFIVFKVGSNKKHEKQSEDTTVVNNYISSQDTRVVENKRINDCIPKDKISNNNRDIDTNPYATSKRE